MTNRPPLLPTYSEYKPTRVLWLDEIPSHWNDLPLKRLATFRSGAGFPIEEQGQQDLELPFYKVSDMNLPGNENTMKTENNSVSRSTAAKLKAYIFPQGTIIFPKVGGAMLTNKRRVLGRPSCIDNNLMGCMVNHGDPNFVFFLLQNTDFALIAKPGPLPAINERDVKNIRVPYPPVEEQAAIARYLTHKDALIQRFLQGKQRMLDLLKQLRKSTIHYAVIHGLDPKNTPMKPSGDSWIGEIPAHWKMQRLKTVCRLAYGNTLTAEMRLDGPVPVYGSNGQIGVHSSANTNAPCIIVGRKGSFGKVNYSEEPAFAIDTAFFVDDRYAKADLRWLYYYLGWLRLDDASRDSAVPGLNRQEAYRRVGPIPPLEEQVAIAKHLDDKVAKIDAAIAVTIRIIDQMRQYRKSLIHEVVTGVRDVRKAAAAIPDDSGDSDA